MYLQDLCVLVTEIQSSGIPVQQDVRENKQVQFHQTLVNDGPISLYFLALLLQCHRLLLYKILLHQEPAVQVTVRTLCMVQGMMSV
nr:unnamed protein product [Mus musculus]